MSPSIKIGIFMPVYNAEGWARDFPMVNGVPHFAVDSGSTDGTPEVLRARGVHVESGNEPRGRVENWKAAAEQFLRTDCEWMKWLFTGDQIDAAMLQLVATEIAKEPRARMVVARYHFVEESGARADSRLFFPAVPDGGAKLIEPPEAAEAIAEFGNWPGPPLAVAIHREAASDWPVSLLDPWTADMELFCRWALRWPTLLVNLFIGEFHVNQRRYFREHSLSNEALLSDHLARQRLLADYPEHAAKAARRAILDLWQKTGGPQNAVEIERLSRVATPEQLTSALTQKLKHKIL